MLGPAPRARFDELPESTLTQILTLATPEGTLDHRSLVCPAVADLRAAQAMLFGLVRLSRRMRQVVTRLAATHVGPSTSRLRRS